MMAETAQDAARERRRKLRRQRWRIQHEKNKKRIYRLVEQKVFLPQQADFVVSNRLLMAQILRLPKLRKVPRLKYFEILEYLRFCPESPVFLKSVTFVLETAKDTENGRKLVERMIRKSLGLEPDDVIEEANASQEASSLLVQAQQQQAESFVQQLEQQLVREGLDQDRDSNDDVDDDDDSSQEEDAEDYGSLAASEIAAKLDNDEEQKGAPPMRQKESTFSQKKLLSPEKKAQESLQAQADQLQSEQERQQNCALMDDEPEQLQGAEEQKFPLKEENAQENPNDKKNRALLGLGQVQDAGKLSEAEEEKKNGANPGIVPAVISRKSIAIERVEAVNDASTIEFLARHGLLSDIRAQEEKKGAYTACKCKLDQIQPETFRSAHKGKCTHETEHQRQLDGEDPAQDPRPML